MKKARNSSPNDLEVRWFDDGGGQHVVVVEAGHELPQETDGGVPVPARVRDGLIEQGGDWTEVQRQAPGKGKGD